MRRRHVIAGAAVLAISATVAMAPLASSAPSSKPLFATMTGAAEVPKADANGTGAATFLFVSPTRICYSLIVNSISKPVRALVSSALASSKSKNFASWLKYF